MPWSLTKHPLPVGHGLKHLPGQGAVLMWWCQEVTCFASPVPAKHLLQTARTPGPACKANSCLMQPGFAAGAVSWALGLLWEARSGKKKLFLLCGSSGVRRQWVAGPGRSWLPPWDPWRHLPCCLPALSPRLDMAPSPCLRPSPPRMPHKMGLGQELPLLWLVSVNKL